MADPALLAEAYRRGLLPPDKKAAYEEAQRRGLIGGKKPTMGQEVSGFMSNLNRSLLIGDEVTAGARTVAKAATGKVPLNKMGDQFKAEMAYERQNEADFAGRHPVAAGIAKGTGNSAALLVPSAKMVQGGRAISAARGAVAAATTAAAYGALDAGTVQGRAQAATRNALNPVVLAVGAGAGALAGKGSPKVSAPKGKALDALRAEKTAAYAAADQAGVRYSPKGFGELVGGVDKAVTTAKINPMRHPKAFSMLEDLRDMAKQGQAPTLTELDQLRQVVRRDVANAPDEAERFFGKKMIAEIDRFIDNADPSQLAQGSGPQAAGLIKVARDLNTRVRKVEAVETGVEKARLRAGSTGSGGNVDNATRQEMRKVLEKTPNLTSDETAALEKIVLGGQGQNLLRLVGKFSPSGNGLMAAGNLASAAWMGPLGAIPGAAGLMSKIAADGITKRNVAELVRLMSAGGSKVTTPGAAAVLAPGAAERVARVAGVTGAQLSAPQPRNALAASPR